MKHCDEYKSLGLQPCNARHICAYTPLRGETARPICRQNGDIAAALASPPAGRLKRGPGFSMDNRRLRSPGAGVPACCGRGPPGTAGKVEYPRSDSNRQHTDFKSVASANWATGARRLPSQAYWKGPEGRKQHDGGPPFRENRRRSICQVKARPSLPASWPGWLPPGRPGEGSSGCAGWSGRGRRLR